MIARKCLICKENCHFPRIEEAHVVLCETCVEGAEKEQQRLRDCRKRLPRWPGDTIGYSKCD